MIAPLAIGLVVSFIATPIVLALARRFRLLDHPGPRSSHRAVTPRGGGLAILAGLLAALLLRRGDWTPTPAVLALLAGAAVVALVGLLDDRFGLPPLPRFLCQLAAALGLVAITGGLERLPLPPPFDFPTGPLGRPLAVLWVVVVVNFTNFMDGIDGLAGVQGAITSLALALAALEPTGTLLAAALAGGCVGFLFFNWAPARIFLGDVGSGLLGYTVAAIPLLAPPTTRTHAVLLAGTSLWLFLADATVCFLRRVVRGERWYEAHRQHLYQRWVAAGAGHARVAACIGLGATATTVLALLAWRTHAPSWAWAGMALGAGLYGLEWGAVRRAERRGR